VNPAIHKRRTQVGRLMRYLFGPGRQEEHVNPHLVAAWYGAGALGALEPPTRANGTRDVAALSALHRQPVHAARNGPALTVWHCSIRNAPEDPVSSDPQWAGVSAEVMDAVKLAPPGDANAVRWVAVRHNDDHIHVVATVVRQDGRTAWAWSDWVNARKRCYELERRIGLRQVGVTAGGTSGMKLLGLVAVTGSILAEITLHMIELRPIETATTVDDELCGPGGRRRRSRLRRPARLTRRAAQGRQGDALRSSPAARPGAGRPRRGLIPVRRVLAHSEPPDQRGRAFRRRRASAASAPARTKRAIASRWYH
jgi:hypothetical protein